MNQTIRNLFLFLLTVFFFSCNQTSVKNSIDKIPILDYVPAPSEMTVKQVVSGRVSTLNEIEIYNVGKNIPFSYAGDKVSNTPGYSWYVSKHFALKTDFLEDQVRLYLNLLEMAWPHYVEIFGAEPPNSENQRIVAVYSASRFEVGIAMQDDGFTRGPGGGGECMFYNRVGYNFKSTREQHQRYIVIHETCHAFQMALMEYTGYTPIWFLEGVADGVAHHTYDPVKNQLNVMNFDRGSNMDYIRSGLNDFEKSGNPSLEKIILEVPFSRGISFLVVHFMMDHPEYSHVFRLFRTEMAKLKPTKENLHQTTLSVLKSLSKDWNKMESDFKDFIVNIDKTFHLAGGPWEQSGNSYFVRFYNPDNGTPRLSILLKPSEKPYFSLFKVDQPLPEKCNLVGNIARGVEEPSVGLKIEFKKDHLKRGKVGMGLGLLLTEKSKENIEKDKKKNWRDARDYNPDDDELFEIWIEEGNKLVFNGKDLGGKYEAFAFSKELLNALESQPLPTIGLNVKITKSSLVATIATGKDAEIQFTATFSITEEIREKLMNRNMAILAENNNHQITLFFDDGRNKNPYPVDLTKECVTNPYRDPNAYEATRLYHAMNIMGENTPEPAISLLNKLIESTDQSPEIKDEMVNELRNKRKNIAKLISSNNDALLAYSGVWARLEWLKQEQTGERPVNAVIYNDSDLPVTGKIKLKISDGTVIDVDLNLNAKTKQVIHHVSPKYDDNSILAYHITGDLNWAGQKLILDHREKDFYPWATMEVIKPAVIENNEIKLATIYRGGLSGENTGTITYEVFPSAIVENSVLVDSVDVEAQKVQVFEKSIKLKEQATVKNVAVDVKYKLSIDGEPIVFKERLYIN